MAREKRVRRVSRGESHGFEGGIVVDGEAGSE